MIDKVHFYDLVKETFLLLDFGDRLFLEQFDLTVPRYYALVHISSAPGLSPSLLSRYMFCDKSNITRLIQGLEIDGLVESRPHERDGRVKRLYLTDAGAARHMDATKAHRRFVTERLAVVENCDPEQCLDLLTRLNQSLAGALDNPQVMLLN